MQTYAERLRGLGVANPLSASALSESALATVNVNAGRLSRVALAGEALRRVRQKLRGLDAGACGVASAADGGDMLSLGESLSVEGQVNSLILQATDPNNLALLFHGWQPYL